jgi:hypothetical protein
MKCLPIERLVRRYLFALLYFCPLVHAAGYSDESCEKSHSSTSEAEEDANDDKGSKLKNLAANSVKNKNKKENDKEARLKARARENLPVLIKEIERKLEKKAEKGETQFSINFSQYHSRAKAMLRMGEKNVVCSPKHKSHKRYNEILGSKLVKHFTKEYQDYDVSMEFVHAGPYADYIPVYNARLILKPY